MENFGEQLKNRRKESGISQSELAERLGVHIQTVSKWERGIMLPDVGKFGDIAKALDLPLYKKERLIFLLCLSRKTNLD